MSHSWYCECLEPQLSARLRHGASSCRKSAPAFDTCRTSGCTSRVTQNGRKQYLLTAKRRTYDRYTLSAAPISTIRGASRLPPRSRLILVWSSRLEGPACSRQRVALSAPSRNRGV